MILKPAQVSIVVDFVPAWLATVLIIFGVYVVIFSYCRMIGIDNISILSPKNSANRTTLAIMFIGIQLVVLPTLIQYSSITAILIYFLGRWIQGAVTVHTISKILFKGKFAFLEVRRRFLSNTSTRTSSISILTNVDKVLNGLFSFIFKPNKLMYLAGIYLLALFCLWLGSVVVIHGPIFKSLSFDLRAIWTSFVFASSLISLLYSYTRINIDIDFIPIGGFVGMFILISATEIYNFGLYIESFLIVFDGIVYFTSIIWGLHNSPATEIVHGI